MEANAPLAVDSNTVLPASVASKGFEPIAWRNAKVVQALGGVQLVKFHHSAPENVLRKSFRRLAVEDTLGALVSEALNHLPIIVCRNEMKSSGITKIDNLFLESVAGRVGKATGSARKRRLRPVESRE